MFQNINELTDLQTMLAGGYIARKQHSAAPLVIYNYTARAQYDNVWNDATLACRGLICDIDGNVVARPFAKFFNLDQVATLPNEPFDVYEKLDGSLGILYWLDDKPCIATRGSFDSEQAQWATRWIRENMPQRGLYRDCTYLFEIIYLANRIVVDYGSRAELVLLAVIVTSTGAELSIDDRGFATAKRYEGIDNLAALAQASITNFEGYVVHFRSGLRVKVKLGEYVRLHKLITGINEKFVLDSLVNGDDLSQIAEQVPDEFNAWLRTTIADLRARYGDIEGLAQGIMRKTVAGSRKEYAEVFKVSRLAPILFAMLDGKDYGKLIWRMIATERKLDGAPKLGLIDG